MEIYTILVVFTLIYISTVFFIAIQLLKTSAAPGTKLPFISIVIAARNEAQRIQAALDSLNNLDYPKDKFEVIWVDDASDDGTADKIKPFTEKNDHWRLIEIQSKNDRLKGKKAALSEAINLAKGTIIMTTDADCRVGPRWLNSFAGMFTEDTAMVLGHALIEKKPGFLDKLLRFDNLFSGIMVAAPAQAGFAISSVGRNLAFTKKAFLDAGGYDTLAQFRSGDDVHLTELLRRKKQGRIIFNAQKDSFTYTKRPAHFNEIINQQIRKNSKLLKKSAGSILLTLILFLFHAALLLYPFIYQADLKQWAYLILVKLVAEFITLLIATKKLGDESIIPYLPFFQIFYPIYVTLIAGLGIFGLYSWKK